MMMKRLHSKSYFLSLLFLLPIFFSFIIHVKSEEVKVLTTSNFDETLKNTKYVFVKFYADWCIYCKRIAPAYAKLPDAFSNIGKDQLVIGQVNGDNDGGLLEKHGIDGFPTLLLFVQGSSEPIPFENRADTTLEHLVSFITKHTGLKSNLPSLSTDAPSTSSSSSESTSHVFHLTSNDFHPTITSKYTLVKFYAPWCGHCKTLAPVYDQLSNIFAPDEDVAIAKIDCTEHQDICQSFSIRGYPTLYLFKKSPESFVKFETKRDLASLVEFVNTHAGSSRLIDGRLDPTFGRSFELDNLIKKFMSSNEKEKSGLLKEASELIGKLPAKGKEYAKFYTLFMERIIEKGSSYIGQELNRLESILRDEELEGKKMDSFTFRSNVLKVFAGEASVLPGSSSPTSDSSMPSSSSPKLPDDAAFVKEKLPVEQVVKVDDKLEL